MDFSLGGWGWGGYGWASAGGYSKTPEVKLLAASLLDNFNRILQQIRHKPALVQAASASSASSASSQANAQASVRPTPLAPALAAMNSVIVQPAVAVVQGSHCAPPKYAPPPTPLAMSGWTRSCSAPQAAARASCRACCQAP